MHPDLKKVILNATQATDLFEINKIQDLWSGYGVITRFGLKGSTTYQTVVVKHVHAPQGKKHPRGWDTHLSHQRKLKSYAVEIAWYREWSQKCSDRCYVPKCLALESHNEEVLIVLEDLNGIGYANRRTSLSPKEMRVCLKWLAHFHATFLGESPKDLWKIGTYWHLDTRPDEWKSLKDRDLKNAATAIDKQLNESPLQTFVHGDAKLANFCFSDDATKVAAVDFQYVGGGCGMKDVAYFIGSCLSDNDCEKYEKELLDYYFSVLTNVVKSKKPHVDVMALEKDWRFLYPFAWTDFHRFIKGWSPGHWKINSYSERLAQKVLESL